MAERARDVQDVRDRVVAELLGLPAPGVPDLASPSVLVARDLAPADTAGLDPSKVLALVTEEGGPTSHTAILARSLGIPAVVACRGILAFEGTSLDVDGDTGHVRESDGKIRAAGTGKKAEWNGVGILKDGLRVKVLGNVGSPRTPPPLPPRVRRASACSARSSASWTPQRNRPLLSRLLLMRLYWRRLRASPLWCAPSTRVRTSRWRF